MINGIFETHWLKEKCSNYKNQKPKTINKKNGENNIIQRKRN